MPSERWPSEWTFPRENTLVSRYDTRILDDSISIRKKKKEVTPLPPDHLLSVAFKSELAGIMASKRKAGTRPTLK